MPVSLLKDTDDPWARAQMRIACTKCHTDQIVTDFNSYPGFCAGDVDVWDLACGHQYTEDNSYLED